MFDASVSWDDSSKTATIIKNFESSIVTSTVQIGDNKISVREYQRSSHESYYKTVNMDVPTMIINRRTMLPLRSVSSALFEGCIWNAGTRTIYLGRNPLTTSVGLPDATIKELKETSMNIVKNALKNPNSAQFSDWEIQRVVIDTGFYIYCTVKSTEGTDYMSFSFEDKGSSYQFVSAIASTTRYADNLDVLGTPRYIYRNGVYTNLKF